MSDPRHLLDAYAAQTDFERGDLMEDREYHAPAAIAALRAVLDAHPMVHLDGELICHGCTHLMCEDEKPVLWPCPTVRAISTALEEFS